jgi:hypothetical protein
MDEETKARFAALDARFTALDAHLHQMMKEINDGFERVLDRMSHIRADTDDTRGHLLYGLNENLTLSQRITKLENDRRKP